MSYKSDIIISLLTCFFNAFTYSFESIKPIKAIFTAFILIGFIRFLITVIFKNTIYSGKIRIYLKILWKLSAVLCLLSAAFSIGYIIFAIDFKLY